MSNTRIVYSGKSTSEQLDTDLQCHANNRNEIYISITMGDEPDSWICLDEYTAVKLSKELRKEIAKIKQNKGGNNG